MEGMGLAAVVILIQGIAQKVTARLLSVQKALRPIHIPPGRAVKPENQFGMTLYVLVE